MADNTQNTGSSKKKKIVTAAIAVALAAILLIGGTFSYLTASSVEVENEFSANYNKVTLTETGALDSDTEDDDDTLINDSFEIIPGTSETKDPTVTATYTLDSYVFLLVDDDTADLVDYDILTTSNGGVWTLLYSEDNEDNPVDGYAVYYTTVTSSTADSTGTATDSEGNSYTYYTDTIKVIVGDKVYYPSTLTNDDMFDDDGNLIGGISLSFMAYIIQADPFDDLADSSYTDAKTALLALLGLYTQYDEDEDTTLTAVVATTIASDSTTDSTSTTFTLTIPAATTIASASSSDDSSSDDTSSDSSDDSSTDDTEDAEDTESSTTPTSLTLSVTETTADTVAVVPGGDAGDYTYEISLVDQDGNSVSATSGYMNVAIQIKTGITNLTVTKLEDESDTTLSTISDTSSISSEGYTYDSSSGVLTIYTQSLGEYEIWWNDTALELLQITEDDELNFLLNGTTQNNVQLGWTLTEDSYEEEDFSYWVVDYALSFNTDISLRFRVITYNTNNKYYQLGSYKWAKIRNCSSTETVLLLQEIFSMDVTDEDNIGYLYMQADDEGARFMVDKGDSSYSITVEMRLYEVSNGELTGKYIVMDTDTYTYTTSESEE